MNKIVVPLIFLINISFISAQNNRKQDSTNLLSFVDKIIVKVSLDTQKESFSVDNNSDEKFKIVTNDQYRLVLSLDYEFIGASIGFAPQFLPSNDDDDLKGKSTFIDYKFRFFLGNWTQNVQYSKAQGFYIENTKNFILNWNEGEDAYIQFPNLKSIFWGGSTSYVLNPSFSLRNVLYNTEWQQKSAGSFIPTLHYGYNRLSNKINDDKTFENSFDIRIASDYYYTWVMHKNWFISPYLSPSLGFRLTEYEEEGVSTKTNSLTKFIHGGLQLGYSSSKIIFGANFNFEKSWIDEDKNTNVRNDKIFGKIYFGYRFNPPKAIEKKMNLINKTIIYPQKT